jgi:hypothetical protein
MVRSQYCILTLRYISDGRIGRSRTTTETNATCDQIFTRENSVGRDYTTWFRRLCELAPHIYRISSPRFQGASATSTCFHYDGIHSYQRSITSIRYHCLYIVEVRTARTWFTTWQVFSIYHSQISADCQCLGPPTKPFLGNIHLFPPAFPQLQFINIYSLYIQNMH